MVNKSPSYIYSYVFRSFLCKPCLDSSLGAPFSYPKVLSENYLKGKMLSFQLYYTVISHNKSYWTQILSELSVINKNIKAANQTIRKQQQTCPTSEEYLKH